MYCGETLKRIKLTLRIPTSTEYIYFVYDMASGSTHMERETADFEAILLVVIVDDDDAVAAAGVA